ncbi:MAG: tryptophan 7-halogenase [Alphaproteobacteria bacterium]
MSRKVQRVVVVGRDIAGWLTAYTLARAFGRTGVTIEVVELPSMLRPIDVAPTLPNLRTLHRLLGFDDNAMIKACFGAPMLGQRFSNWSRGAPFVHAYDTQGVALNRVEFLNYWVRARREGLNVALEDFSLGAAAAKQARLIVPNEETMRFSHAAPGYNVEAVAYALLMQLRAKKFGVIHTPGSVAAVDHEGDRIRSVRLANGPTVEGDLFVDASGAEAVLMRDMPGDAFQSWSHWFGVDRILAASGPRLTPIPGFSEISAFRAGWLGLYPLQQRTGVIAAFDSKEMSEREMVEDLPALSGVNLKGDALVAPFSPGARARPWIGNCVALGEAAATFEPLDCAPMQALQVGLSHLAALFPADADEMAESAIFNANMEAWNGRLRDFQLAHYKLNGRRGDPFWDRARAMSVSDALDYKIKLFEARGVVALYDHESFQDENWISIFVGHGLMPRDYDPIADTMPPEEQIENFRQMLSFVAAEVQDMPSLEAHLELHAPSSAVGQ